VEAPRLEKLGSNPRSDDERNNRNDRRGHRMQCATIILVVSAFRVAVRNLLFENGAIRNCNVDTRPNAAKILRNNNAREGLEGILSASCIEQGLGLGNLRRVGREQRRGVTLPRANLSLSGLAALAPAAISSTDRVVGIRAVGINRTHGANQCRERGVNRRVIQTRIS